MVLSGVRKANIALRFEVGLGVLGVITWLDKMKNSGALRAEQPRIIYVEPWFQKAERQLFTLARSSSECAAE